MTAQHTPGPWSLCGPDTDLVRDGNYRAVARASFRATPTVNLIHETKANARLIAAAPELLEALTRLVEDLEMRSNWKRGDDKGVVDCGHSVYLKARAAIAKAGGAA